VPGWEGKGKGSLQILWERGWTDEAKVSEYRLMNSCAGFMNEMLQLQFVCHSLGAEALTTTKYHAKYAG
jgi:hypothetical protein